LAGNYRKTPALPRIFGLPGWESGGAGPLGVTTMAIAKRRRPHLENLRLSAPFKRFDDAVNYSLRVVENGSGTPLFLVIDRGDCENLKELLSIWNSQKYNEPMSLDPQIRI
jgi:hypothetical protein